MRHNLRPPLPPRLPPARTLGTQLNDGFAGLGSLLSGLFHLALALLVGWLALSVIDPILGHWSGSWFHGSAWLKHLIHLLFN